MHTTRNCPCAARKQSSLIWYRKASKPIASIPKAKARSSLLQATKLQPAAPRTAVWKSKSSVHATSNTRFRLDRSQTPLRRGFFMLVNAIQPARIYRFANLRKSALQAKPSLFAIILPMNADHSLNAAPAELRKFSELAHRWWDPSSEFRPLHEINPLRLEWINAKPSLAGITVLDVGGGGGILAESMARKGANVTGIELSEKALKVADLHSLESGVRVRYELISAEALAAREPARYDVVTCMEMLEHVPDPAAVVQACSDLVKPGGHVFFSTLNRNPKSYLFAVIGAEYILKLLPRGTHDYAKFITPAELAQFVRHAGMEVGALKGMTYNPLTPLYSIWRALLPTLRPTWRPPSTSCAPRAALPLPLMKNCGRWLPLARGA